MRRAIAWIVDGLPFDPRSRRAIDETLLDWTHEAAVQSSVSRRCVADIVGLLAVLRAVTVSTWQEAHQVPVRWLSIRLVFFVVMPAILLSVPYVMFLAGSVSFSDLLGLMAVVTPGLIPEILPLALLLALMWRPASLRVPPAGTALAAGAGTFVFVAWILPAFDRTFGDWYVRTLTQAFGSRIPAGNEPTVLDLMSATGIAGLSVRVASSVILADCLAKRIQLRRLGWIAGVPTFYLTAGALAGAAVRLMVPATFVSAGTNWLLAVSTLVVAVTVQRKTDRDSAPAARFRRV